MAGAKFMLDSHRGRRQQLILQNLELGMAAKEPAGVGCGTRIKAAVVIAACLGVLLLVLSIATMWLRTESLPPLAVRQSPTHTLMSKAPTSFAPAAHPLPTEALPAPPRDSMPLFLTLLASRNETAMERFRSEASDIVLMDYSPDHSTRCSYCVHSMVMRGVKWELLEAFFASSWWSLNKYNYKWLWYPDDDLVFAPGDIERMFNLVESSNTFHVVQASLCSGSQISHPTMEQTPEDPEPIIHMYSIELQQPLGLITWWETLWERGYFEGQTFGFGLDTVWRMWRGTNTTWVL